MDISGAGWRVLSGSCLDRLPELADNSIDAVVTDPPYELGFMGKSWDSSGIAFNPQVWAECLRVLKPGGHLLAFGGSRTWHRIAVAIEDAGFEVRDSIAWLYGSGFPKSHNISIAIDKQANVMSHRGKRFENTGLRRQGIEVETPKGAPAHKGITLEAQKWAGWGTALKPAFEPVIVARKPLIGTVAANVLQYGTGGLNIDGSRIGTEPVVSRGGISSGANNFVGGPSIEREPTVSNGRWPANVILDPFTAELLDEQSGVSVSKAQMMNSTAHVDGWNLHRREPSVRGHDDSGGASRFFYVAKASKRDRNEGLNELPTKHTGTYAQDEWSRQHMGNTPDSERKPVANFHPTVKPTDLMRYLVKLVTPPGGVVLDPFTGSGSTGKAAILEGFEFIGCELTDDYLPIIEGRLTHAVETVKQERADNEAREKETLF